MRKIFLTVLCIVHFGLQAQDSLKSTMLNEVVVSATRTEQSIIETPRSVSVINRNEIEKSVYNSVGELLSKQQGVYMVGATQTPGTNQSMFMRGANSNQVMVLVDGMRISDPSSPNAVIDLSELSLTDVEQIEIIRGSHSTMYGGSAIGGVVNIITRKNQKQGLNGRASLQGGTFGNGANIASQDLDLNYSLKNGLYFNGSLTNQYTNGLNAALDTAQSGGVYKSADRDGFTKTDAYVKAGYKQGKWNGSILYKKVKQNADIDNGTYTDDDNNYVEFSRNLTAYQLGYQLNSSLRLSFQGSWSGSDRVNENDSSQVDEAGNYDHNYFYGKYFGQQLTNEVQMNYKYKNITGVLGAGMYDEDMHFNTYFFSNAFGPYESKVNYDSIDTSAKTKYGFVQLNWLVNHFSLSGGARLSNHSRFGNSFTFELNPSYRIGNFLVYGSVSSGYNAPSLYQLFDPTQDFGSYTTKGNKQLNPEQSISFEAGIKKEFASGNYVTASAFHTKVKNTIEYVYLWEKNTNITDLSYLDYRGDTYLNISEQKVSGLELEANVNVGSKLYFKSNLTWMAGEIHVDPSSIDQQQTGGHHVQLFSYGSFVDKEVTKDYLVRRPKAMGLFEAGYRILNNLTTNIVYRYTGSRPDSQYDYMLGPYGALGQSTVKAYHLVDINVHYQLNKNISVAAKVENVFDQDYQEIIGFQTRGRSAYLKLNFRW